MGDAVRWNVEVSKATDEAVRSMLGPERMGNGELSEFIEEAVRWQIFAGLWKR